MKRMRLACLSLSLLALVGCSTLPQNHRYEIVEIHGETYLLDHVLESIYAITESGNSIQLSSDPVIVIGSPR